MSRILDICMFFIAFTEGEPEKFTIGALDQPLRIAVPFQVINQIVSTCVATILRCKLSTMLHVLLPTRETC